MPVRYSPFTLRVAPIATQTKWRGCFLIRAGGNVRPDSPCFAITKFASAGCEEFARAKWLVTVADTEYWQVWWAGLDTVDGPISVEPRPPLTSAIVLPAGVRRVPISPGRARHFQVSWTFKHREPNLKHIPRAPPIFIGRRPKVTLLFAVLIVTFAAHGGLAYNLLRVTVIGARKQDTCNCLITWETAPCAVLLEVCLRWQCWNIVPWWIVLPAGVDENY